MTSLQTNILQTFPDTTEIQTSGDDTPTISPIEDIITKETITSIVETEMEMSGEEETPVDTTVIIALTDELSTPPQPTEQYYETKERAYFTTVESIETTSGIQVGSTSSPVLTKMEDLITGKSITTLPEIETSGEVETAMSTTFTIAHTDELSTPQETTKQFHETKERAYFTTAEFTTSATQIEEGSGVTSPLTSKSEDQITEKPITSSGESVEIETSVEAQTQMSTTLKIHHTDELSSLHQTTEDFQETMEPTHFRTVESTFVTSESEESSKDFITDKHTTTFPDTTEIQTSGDDTPTISPIEDIITKETITSIVETEMQTSGEEETPVDTTVIIALTDELSTPPQPTEQYHETKERAYFTTVESIETTSGIQEGSTSSPVLTTIEDLITGKSITTLPEIETSGEGETAMSTTFTIAHTDELSTPQETTKQFHESKERAYFTTAEFTTSATQIEEGAGVTSPLTTKTEDQITEKPITSSGESVEIETSGEAQIQMSTTLKIHHTDELSSTQQTTEDFQETMEPTHFRTVESTFVTSESEESSGTTPPFFTNTNDFITDKHTTAFPDTTEIQTSGDDTPTISPIEDIITKETITSIVETEMETSGEEETPVDTTVIIALTDELSTPPQPTEQYHETKERAYFTTVESIETTSGIQEGSTSSPVLTKMEDLITGISITTLPEIETSGEVETAMSTTFTIAHTDELSTPQETTKQFHETKERAYFTTAEFTTSATQIEEGSGVTSPLTTKTVDQITEKPITSSGESVEIETSGEAQTQMSTTLKIHHTDELSSIHQTTEDFQETMEPTHFRTVESTFVTSESEESSGTTLPFFTNTNDFITDKHTTTFPDTTEIQTSGDDTPTPYLQLKTSLQRKQSPL